MAPRTEHRSAPGPSREGGERERIDGDSLARLFRYSHIFASLVHEILEEKMLKEVCPYPLTPSQFYLLKLMTLDGHFHVGQMGGFLGMSAPAATKNIDKLQRHGLVTRSPCAGDRRATCLSVSPRGERIVRTFEKLKARRMRRVLEGFREEEIERLTELLERFTVSLLEKERTGRGFCMRCGAYIENGCPVADVRGGCPYEMVAAMRGTDPEINPKEKPEGGAS
jgi:DNA-binding MarR family transcriptional regulator